MSSPVYLRSTVYSGISDRQRDGANVESALNQIINAGPTQIQPDDREGFLDSLLGDLEPEKGIWRDWTTEILVLALTAIRVLGRNPIGSTALLSSSHLSTLLYHSALPLAPSTWPDTALATRPTFHDASATETLKVLANLLLLHAAGRNRFHKAGGAEAIALALAGGDHAGSEVEDVEDMSAERVFLLARIGFLVTLERKEAVEVTVNQHHVVDTLTQHLYHLQPIPKNFDALSELFKLSANLIRFYPQKSEGGEEAWDDAFEPLLPATLHHFHLLPYTDLAPPLSNVIQVLLFIPFVPSLSIIWSSVPTRSRSSSPKRSPSPVKQLLSKISDTISNVRKNSTDATSSPGGLAPPRTPSPLPDRPSSPSGSSGRATRYDPKALPKRLLAIFDAWCGSHLAQGISVDEERRDGVVLDEVLPPLLLVMMKCSAGSVGMKKHLKDTLLPAGLDRSASAGPLEKRAGTLGNLLRLMTCSNHPACRDSAGELMWAVCDSDPAILSKDIGYGNAAGLLFRKGLSGPPPAKIEEIDDAPAEERHPITALDRTAGDNQNPALDAMSEEEKEREAERLFVLFDRLEKTKIMSAQTGGGDAKGVREMMEEKLRSGEFSEADAAREVEEETKRREEEEKEEEEALRDLREYKARQGKKT